MPIQLVSANIGPTQSIPANGSIELGFDRLLLPASITRQTFVLENAGNTIGYTPTVAYDPVARIVTITPVMGDPKQPFVSGQSYELVILPPQNPADVNGIRTVDGATLAGGVPRVIAFSVTDAVAPRPTVQIDFCRDIYPITSKKCSLAICHGEASLDAGVYPASGLQLDPPSGISKTAVGRVSIESNTGPLAQASPASLLFAEDMPIIDTTGNSSNSWMLYKILLAAPSPEPVDAGQESPGDAAGEDAAMNDAGGADAEADATLPADAGSPETGDAGGADGGTADGAAAGGGATDGGDAGGMAATPVVPPIDVSGVHGLAWTAISATERATLSNYVLGREMPYPPLGMNLNDQNDPLTLNEMERVNLWIVQGAKSRSTCIP